MFNGIFPPITTPFVNDEVAYDKLAENISKWNNYELKGYVVLGSNGEAVFLTREEKLRVIETTKEFMSVDKTLIVGTGSDSIKETIALTNDAAEIGANAALVITPSFFKDKMNHNEFINHFNAVADLSLIPLIIYNVPKFTGVDIEPRTVVELSRHENIIGIKNSSENLEQLTEIITDTPNNFQILVGTASILENGLRAGADGGILALANIAAQECINIYKFVESEKFIESENLQLKLLEINKTVTSKYGVAGLKAAMDLLGYFGGLPRLPLSPLTDIEVEEVKSELIKSNLLDS